MYKIYNENSIKIIIMKKILKLIIPLIPLFITFYFHLWTIFIIILVVIFCFYLLMNYIEITLKIKKSSSGLNQLLDINYIKDLIIQFKIKHIALILDGNRRWSNKNNKSYEFGYKIGSNALKNIIIFCNNLGIKYLTAYTYSTENLKRNKDETDKFMNVFLDALKNDTSDLIKIGVVFKFIGNQSQLPDSIKNSLLEIEEKTKNNNSIHLQIAFNYGSKEEIVSAIKSITNKVLSQKIQIEEINEKIVSDELYTKNIPDPDFVIRTGGCKRISNFLLWQIAYSEIIYFDEYWPDFNEHKLKKAIIEFSKRNRTFGR